MGNTPRLAHRGGAERPQLGGDLTGNRFIAFWAIDVGHGGSALDRSWRGSYAHHCVVVHSPIDPGQRPTPPLPRAVRCSAERESWRNRNDRPVAPMSRYRRSAEALASGVTDGSRGGSGASTISKSSERTAIASDARLGRAASVSSSSRDRPKGIHPSPSSRARRSERRVRPPTQMGTCRPAPRWARRRSPRTRSVSPA